MYRHVGEAFIPLSGASCVADKLYKKITKFHNYPNLEGFEKSVDFKEGGAIIQSTNDGLILRVFAHDVLTFYGIRTLIEGGLPEVIFRSVDRIEWLPQKDRAIKKLQSELCRNKS